MLAGVALGSRAVMSLSMRNRWPSGDTSWEGTYSFEDRD